MHRAEFRSDERYGIGEAWGREGPVEAFRCLEAEK